MIVSASRRTDIPAFYFDWFSQRLRDEYVLARNPFNPHQISRISLSPATVDGIVFWTKNPLPMLGNLANLREYAYYFQYTITGYPSAIEPSLPSEEERISAFVQLSDVLGPDRVRWRYDPVFVGEGQDMEYHLRSFERLAGKLSSHTHVCTVSFMDFYACTKRNMRVFRPRDPELDERTALVRAFGEIGRSAGIEVQVCAESMDLSACGVGASTCIDAAVFERQSGRFLQVPKDRNQRSGCRCVRSVDIGAYGTCRHGCRYCYANHSERTVEKNCAAHDPSSPLLIGRVRPDDKIVERSAPRAKQLSFFDAPSEPDARNGAVPGR